MKHFLSFLFLLAAGTLVCLPLACNNSLPGAPSNAVAGAPLAAGAPTGQNYQFVNSWSGPSTSTFSNPWGVALSGGLVWTVDPNNDILQEDNSNGGFLKNVASANSLMNFPEGMVIQGQTIYVADDSNDGVEKFGLDGSYQGFIGAPNGDSLNDVAVDSKGNIYMTSAGPCDIYKVDPNGNLLVTYNLGCNSQVGNPTGIALDASGNVVIADQPDGIVLYGSGGGWQGNFLGFGNATFNYPDLVRVDGSNHLFVTDYNNSVVYKGDETGNLLATIGGCCLSNPQGLAVDNQGQNSLVYVSDASNQDVELYSGPN